MKGFITITLGIILITMCSFNPAEKQSIDVFDFDSNSDISSWRIINDDVMGGVSSSSFKLNTNGKGVFKGSVSTDNYGGFASVRYTMRPINVANMNSIKIRIKGDGKDYQFRIKQKASDYYSYIKSFSTNGNWQTIELKLNDFYPGSRGRKLDMPNFDKNVIEQISILIANKKNETFEIKIDKIELVSN